MDETIYKIALAGYLHDIGKFAERAHDKNKRATENEEKIPGFFPDEKFINDNMDLYQPHFKDKYTHKHAVYTAAFIDHLEKILPEQFNKEKWGPGDSFMNLAAGHHKPETPMQWIIAMADRISSGFDRQEFEDYNNEIAVRDYKKTRLLTIFEGINLKDKWKDNLEKYDYRYPLKELAPETIFPVKHTNSKDDMSNKEYSNLFFNFVDSLEKLKHKQNIHIWLEHFDSLFMIYASNIPAATVGRVIPDISLYDHSKMTSALASSIYLYHKHNNTLEDIGKIKDDYENKKFLIITGDFYGIQDFIFSEGGSTGKAAAKLLRGRSFAVSLISELAADMLCREIGLTISSIVLNAAGKFTIIAPNTESALKAIEEVEKKINKWLIKNFFGESTFGISRVKASYNDFEVENKSFNNLMENLSKKSEIRKLTKIDLDKFGGAVENYLDGFNNDLNKKLCPFCGKRPSQREVEKDPLLGEEKSACKICRDHIYIGTNLVKSDKIAITTIDANIHGQKLKEPIFDGYQLSFDVSGDLNELSKEGSLIKYWSISGAINGNISKEITAKFINGYTPKYEEEDNQDSRLLAGGKKENKKLELIDYIKEGYPKTFLHLAKKSLNGTDKPDKFTGIEALGCLKADVDNLGLIFTCGLQHNNLSRTATMSRQLNYFFSVYLPYILGNHAEFKNIYTVFAGGDDLFLIGPWNIIIDFASFLNDKFKEYVCENQDITISAGISINKPDMPVLSFSETAENALKKSKENYKDSLTLFGESVKWDEFKKLEEIKFEIKEWLECKCINKSMLFRFNNFIELARQEKGLKKLDKFNMEDIECLQWRAKFKYNLIRNIGKDLNEQGRKDAVKMVEESAEWIEMYAGAMKISLWQIIYNQRR